MILGYPQLWKPMETYGNLHIHVSSAYFPILRHPWWMPGGSLVDPWWMPGGSLVGPWWVPGSQGMQIQRYDAFVELRVPKRPQSCSLRLVSEDQAEPEGVEELELLIYDCTVDGRNPAENGGSSHYWEFQHVSTILLVQDFATIDSTKTIQMLYSLLF